MPGFTRAGIPAMSKRAWFCLLIALPIAGVLVIVTALPAALGLLLDTFGGKSRA